MAVNSFGIDIGTNNIKIYNRHTDDYFMEKNMIAIEGKNHLFAYGDSAFEMYEKSPENIHVTYPLNNGVIAEIEHMQTLIRYFISDIGKGTIKPADYYIAVPTDITDVEKRSFYELIKNANVKAKKVYVVEKAAADALGMDIDVKHSQGVFMVDVGFDTTEITILSMGGIVASRLLKFGGRAFDESIRSAVRKEHNLYIGAKTAEKIKYSLKEMISQDKNAIIYGRDIVTGLPAEKAIGKQLVYNCLKEQLSEIAYYVKQILERTPPELGADIYHNGIYLTGGGSQIPFLTEIISNTTGLKVNVNPEPMAGVVKGLATIIRNEKFHSLAYTIEGAGR